MNLMYKKIGFILVIILSGLLPPPVNLIVLWHPALTNMPLEPEDL